MKKFYITTPIYYVNDRPHIGHTYTTVAADALARFHRMIGDNTFFSAGTDEHGAKIEVKAREFGREPKEFVDEISAHFQFIWDELNISNDRFIRTTDEKHKQAVQNALLHMKQNGDIYLGKYKGLYCRDCEQFLNEKDLIDGLCPDHRIKPELVSEETYMFRMSNYSEKLLKKIESDELKIRPQSRKNEIISFYKNEGLKDISFSRKKVKWGILLPWRASHTAYVWADAFLNYLTILDWKGAGEKLTPPYQEGDTQRVEGVFWPPDVQLMSKDILRVHATIWPAMLLSLGLPLPKQIFVHGFFLLNGHKMSKSLGNIIRPEDFKKKYGVDGTRYLLLNSTTFGRDGDISWEKFDEKFNADLANGLGNLAARSLALAVKMKKAGINPVKTKGSAEKIDDKIFDHRVDLMWESFLRLLNNLEIDKALGLAMIQVKFLDNYLTLSKPWEIAVDKSKHLGEVIYNVLERLRHIGLMLWPFMPETAEKIWENLGLNPADEMKKDFEKACKWGGLKIKTKIKKGDSLFPRI